MEAAPAAQAAQIVRGESSVQAAVVVQAAQAAQAVPVVDRPAAAERVAPGMPRTMRVCRAMAQPALAVLRAGAVVAQEAAAVEHHRTPAAPREPVHVVETGVALQPAAAAVEGKPAVAGPPGLEGAPPPRPARSRRAGHPVIRPTPPTTFPIPRPLVVTQAATTTSPTSQSPQITRRFQALAPATSTPAIAAARASRSATPSSPSSTSAPTTTATNHARTTRPATSI